MIDVQHTAVWTRENNAVVVDQGCVSIRC